MTTYYHVSLLEQVNQLSDIQGDECIAHTGNFYLMRTQKEVPCIQHVWRDTVAKDQRCVRCGVEKPQLDLRIDS